MAQPGDWSHILVAEGGYVDMQYTEFHYGGFPHTHTTGWVYGATEQAQVIANTAGTLRLDHVLFARTYMQDHDVQYHSTIWIDGPASTTIQNTTFDGGYMAVKSISPSHTYQLSDSTIRSYTHPEGPVVSRVRIPHMLRNVFEENVFDGVYIMSPETTGAERLSASHPWMLGQARIPNSSTLYVDPGAVIYMLPRADIVVEGTLTVGDLAGAAVRMQAAQEGIYWGSIIVDNATTTIHNAHIREGNHSLIKLHDNGMLISRNSTVALDDVTLVDARRPYNMIHAADSALDIRNSRISWTTKKALPAWHIVGVKMMGGALNIENTTFQGMDRGIEGYQGAIGSMQHMDETAFTSTTMPWWPEALFGIIEDGG